MGIFEVPRARERVILEWGNPEGPPHAICTAAVECNLIIAVALER